MQLIHVNTNVDYIIQHFPAFTLATGSLYKQTFRISRKHNFFLIQVLYIYCISYDFVKLCKPWTQGLNL